ncbi:podoplanin isoform X2 [Ascaphus truei]|uniref:podoplanin isoform X2 n=1 Tax=Ascaphus truei TaxID=8439 RepID=UPI003F59E6E9
MYKLQILAFLLVGLSLCAMAQKEEETATLDTTEKTSTHSAELQTQAPTEEVNVTEPFDIVTEDLTMETDTLNPGNDNSTNTVVIEDSEGLEIGTLIGIIAGIVLLIGISAIIIILIFRKMGRYSPEI